MDTPSSNTNTNGTCIVSITFIRGIIFHQQQKPIDVALSRKLLIVVDDNWGLSLVVLTQFLYFSNRNFEQSS